MKITLDFCGDCAILYPVMRDKMIYTVYWKNEDTNRVSHKDFTGQDGVDHSAMDDAMEHAQVVDGNMWPWLLERDGEEVAYGWGGDLLGSYRYQG
jgi:hypothetical protein